MSTWFFSCSPSWSLETEARGLFLWVTGPRYLELFHLEKRRLKVDLIAFYIPFFFFLPYYLNCGWSKVEDSPFPQITSDRIRGNVLKLQEGRFKLDLRKIFFIERVVKPSNTLVRDLPFHQEKILGLCWIYSLKLKSPSLPVLSGWMQSCIRQRIIESFRSEEISRIIKLNLWHISGFSL